MLVITTVSCANVPQLAADLLVSTLGLQLRQKLPCGSMYPFVAAEGGEIRTALELYANEEVSVLLQRSPVLPDRIDDFVELVRKIAQDQEVILLTSADAATRTDEDMRRDRVFQPEGLDDLQGVGELRELCEALKPSRTLCLFAYQGDNREDAKALASAVIPRDAWKEPASWAHVYGAPVSIGEDGMFW
ncbi:hypothetical protein PYCC9005_005351 [Savitreella phatthalungensis]